MVQSFNRADTQSLFETGKFRRLANIKDVAERKPTRLAAATTLAFLKSPPGNHLEALTGDRAGPHSVHVNKQGRAGFVCLAHFFGDASRSRLNLQQMCHLKVVEWARSRQIEAEIEPLAA